MDKKIYITNWLELKPYTKQRITDNYYLKISNDVKKAITGSIYMSGFEKYLPDENKVDVLSCFLTSYLEDLVSGTNIWNTFIKIHKHLYGKQLPFYNLDEYYEEEINLQDVKFLIWYFINCVNKAFFVYPHSDFISGTAERIMDLFEKVWEYAPKNKYLQPFYQIDENEDDFYTVRNLIDTVLFKTYLFHPDTYFKLQEKELEILNKAEDEERTLFYLNEARDDLLHTDHTRILGLTGKEWVSEIIPGNTILSKDILEMSKAIRGLFLYKGQDQDYIFLEHIALGKKFNLLKKSYEFTDELKDLDTIFYVGISRWKNDWWFSGVSFQQPFNADLVKDEKKSLSSKKAVSFLYYNQGKTKKILEFQMSAFLEFNKGSQIAFLPATKIETFYKSYIEHYNNSLNLSEKERREAQQRAKKNGILDTDNSFNDFSKISETGLVFFNPKSGVEIAMDINSAFPMSLNPFFETESSNEHVEDLLMNEEFSTELVIYCIDNCKNKLPFFADGIGKKYLKDIDFLLRFLKKNNYHSVPSITYTGEKE